MKTLPAMIFLCLSGAISQADEIPQPGKIGSGALLGASLIYSLENRPTPQCHASTIVETQSGSVAAWPGGKHERNTDVGI